MIGDNYPTNKLLARLLHVNIIGCASHRFNLAVIKIIDEYETLITKIHNLMTKLLTLNNSAKLRKQTKLRPLTKNITRWSSIYSMVQIYNELKNYIDNTDASYGVIYTFRLRINPTKYFIRQFKKNKLSYKVLTK